MFEDTDWRGSSISYTSERDCTTPVTDVDFTTEYVGDAWNDEMESYRTFRNCYVRLWQNRGFLGAMLDFAGDRSDFGILGDEVSSIQWS